MCQQHHDFALEEWQKRQAQSIHSDNIKIQSKGFAQYIYIKQIFYIILGIITFGIVDRLNDPMDEGTFPQLLLQYGIPTQTTGVWLLVNAVVWMLFVWLFHLLPNFISKYCCIRRKHSDLKIEVLVNKFINIEKLKAYLKLKHLTADTITTNHIQIIRTVSWDENNYHIWKGKLPKFEMIYDRKNKYLLSVTITIENNNGMWQEEEITNRFLGDLKFCNVFAPNYDKEPWNNPSMGVFDRLTLKRKSEYVKGLNLDFTKPMEIADKSFKQNNLELKKTNTHNRKSFAKSKEQAGNSTHSQQWRPIG